MKLKLCLLGGFSAHIEGQDAGSVRITSRKGRALLAYVAMRPDFRAGREQLADLLWGNRTDSEARHSLRQCLLLLRRELGAAGAEVLTVAGDDIRLEAQQLTVDAVEFQLLAGSNDTGELARAASLYDGEFLGGMSLDAEAFNEWLQEERKRLESAAVDVFERLAKLTSAEGDGVAAIGAAERLVAVDPLREDWQRLLIRLYAQHRSPEAALAHAKTVSDLLRQELDVDPAQETLALVAQIRRTSTPPASRAGEVDTPLSRADRAAGSERGTAPPSGSTQSNAPGMPDGELSEGQSTASHVGIAARQPWRLWPIGVGSAAIALGVVAIVLLRPPAANSPGPQVEANAGKLDAGGILAEPSWLPPPRASAAKVDTSALAAKGLYAVAVLPFAVEEAKDGDRVITDRIASDLVADLSRVPAIRVISWHTTRQYAGQAIDVASVGAELGARYVIVGSVRRQQSRLHVSVALIDSRDRLQVWSERVERDLSERAAVQDEITRGLARRLQLGVLATEGRRSEWASPQDPATGRLLAKGWAAFLTSVSSGTKGPAETYFSAALERDPANVSALAGLGAYHAVVAGLQLDDDRPAHIAKAKQLLTLAIEKAPFFSLPRYHLGRVQRMHGDFAGARALFAQAVELNPSYAPAYAQMGHLIGLMGQPDEGLEYIRYALRLSPRDPAAALWRMYAGQLALEQGKDQEALDWLKRAVALSPRNPMCRAFLAAAYALTGNAADAAAQVAEVRKLAPWITGESMMRRLAGPPDRRLKTQRLISGIRMAFAKSG